MNHRHYLAYGFSITSEVALPGAGPASGDDRRTRPISIAAAKVRVVGREVQPGRLLSSIKFPDGRGLALTEADGIFTLRYLGYCDFEISTDLTVIRPYRDPSCDPRWVGTFLASSVLGHVLVLAGEPCLHSAAVSFPEGVISLAGVSGSGKSTLAALLCEAGGHLVTDDLLCLRFTAGGVECYPGSRQLRLKGPAAALAGSFPQGSRRLIDGRTAIEMTGETPSTRLSAVVLPRPSRTDRTLDARRLGEKSGLLSLMAVSSLAAWNTPQPNRKRFEYTAEIARRVPVFSAVVPWGPPFDKTVAIALRNLLGRDHSGVAAAAPI